MRRPGHGGRIEDRLSRIDLRMQSFEVTHDCAYPLFLGQGVEMPGLATPRIRCQQRRGTRCHGAISVCRIVEGIEDGSARKIGDTDATVNLIVEFPKSGAGAEED